MHVTPDGEREKEEGEEMQNEGEEEGERVWEWEWECHTHASMYARTGYMDGLRGPHRFGKISANYFYKKCLLEISRKRMCAQLCKEAKA